MMMMQQQAASFFFIKKTSEQIIVYYFYPSILPSADKPGKPWGRLLQPASLQLL